MWEHRQQYGVSGNCFDLALWLLDEFIKDGIAAYPVGVHLHTRDAHVAVIAIDEEGNRFLCDLGDQWISPILVDAHSAAYTNESLAGFFPAAKVQVLANPKHAEILYHRPNGKVSRQRYSLQPIDITSFLQAAEFSQNLIKPIPLLECRIPYKSEIAHWEFYNWDSFLSTSEGIFPEPTLESIEYWVNIINQNTNMDKNFLFGVLEQYKNI